MTRTRAGVAAGLLALAAALGGCASTSGTSGAGPTADGSGPTADGPTGPGATSSPRPSPASPAGEATGTAVVTVGDDLEFRVEVARTAEAQQQGLSGRVEVPPRTGMLFPFDGPAERQVWMAGMRFPIDVAWIADGAVLAVDTLEPCTEPEDSTCPRWTWPGPADALLEVPAGALDGVGEGTPVRVQEDDR
ncbi:DUF192 domain-containing protein [Georgenia faecalis]|uniref:DUF192 domain-containing protein n=1 Tax=Georgenia faecalis TaxID=2483799 RepID=A0ABV9D5P6_9MICO|nr:DUF192 domain-containing protein [Georgenia faecalis]